MTTKQQYTVAIAKYRNYVNTCIVNIVSQSCEYRFTILWPHSADCMCVEKCLDGKGRHSCLGSHIPNSHRWIQMQHNSSPLVEDVEAWLILIDRAGFHHQGCGTAERKWIDEVLFPQRYCNSCECQVEVWVY